MEQLNTFEGDFLEQWLVEIGVEAYVEGDEIVFTAPNLSETFKRMIVVHALCAVDVANRHLSADTGRGFEAMKKLASVGGAEIVEVYAATCHLVRPLVNEIMGRWLCDPAKADMIGDAAGAYDHSPGSL